MQNPVARILIFGAFGSKSEETHFTKSGSSFLTYLPMRHFVAGGDGGSRTHDLLLARQALSQLSYTPISGLIPEN